MKVNLRARFTIFIATTSLALLILFSFLVYGQAKTKSYAFAKQSLTDLLEHEWEHLDLPHHSDPSLKSTPHFRDVYLRIRKAGSLVYDSFPRGFPDTFPPQGELAKHKLFQSTAREHNGHAYELQGFYDLVSTETYLSSLSKILFIACLLAALVLVPLSFLSTRILLKPFRELALGTSKLSAEKLTYRFPQIQSMDEYGILTKNFNELLDRLEKAFTQTKRFALNASHELRTPLAVIISQGEIALRRDRSLEENRNALEKMLVSAKRLREIINRLLFLAELDRLRQESRIATIEVESTVQSLVDAIKDAHRPEEKKVSVISANRTESFTGTKEVFDVVLSNLIENAYKFAKDSVLISYERDNGSLKIKVEDDGPGIPSEHYGLVLEPLAHPKKIENPPKKGSGLGLSIVKACLDSIKGTIDFSNSKLGGVCVTVTFPQRA